MKLYPIMLKLAGKKVAIVGGGAIAYRKAAGLAETGADIVVISPQLHESFAALSVSWRNKRFEPEDITGAHLVFAATDDAAVNRQVAEAAADWQWVDVTSEQELSAFYVPAVVRRGDLVLAVSTSGASPALAKRVKQELEQQYGEEYVQIVQHYKHERKKR
ncbi:precorrin-2 dehydrogenase/sirohydrochlorin ferrochelatase family protein [Ectobacillus ponti]|uniref:precorrin-2 dehydrogenase n=1 Tax=Ectobacillus ponti TaxID=2961894 RepID=A0AA42BQK3_9BACI|nr:NAD(P)-dependent oxidoreductase [Ectobacillus ponti]MCP8968544.1 NAD(P)-dependent oxidoreductase [Ectobacillus ponti]